MGRVRCLVFLTHGVYHETVARVHLRQLHTYLKVETGCNVLLY